MAKKIKAHGYLILSYFMYNKGIVATFQKQSEISMD